MVRPLRLAGFAAAAGAAVAAGWLLSRWRQRRDRDARYAAALAIARRLPKTELHLHLDGSLPFEFIVRRAKARGVDCPSSPEAFREMVDEAKRARARRARSNDARAITRVGAGKNWPIFDFMNQLLQSREELEEATYLLASSLRRDHNVWLAEIRFCPALHTLEGLTEDAVVRTVVAGFERARDETGVCGGVILCALRSRPAPHPLDTARLARDHLGRGVIGFDVAGSENYGLSDPAIREALVASKGWGMPVTVHAGELPRGMVPNLEAALDLRASRIGHGLGLGIGDAVDSGASSELLRRYAEQGIHVEVCLTGNVTASRVPSYAAHPIRAMLAAGVRVSLSSDNLTLSGDGAVVGGGAYPAEGGYMYAHPSGEVAHAVADCGVGWHAIPELLLNGARASFSGDATPGFLEAFEAAIAAALAG